MEKLKVLKLGWEFPPLINGGLGIACYGLSKALSELVDLTVIVPQAPAAGSGQNFELQGLNNMTPADLSTSKSYSFSEFAQVAQIPIALDPYFSDESEGSTTVITEEGVATVVEKSIREKLELFRSGDLYGEDVGAKVIEFAKICARIALQTDFDIVHAHDWMTYLAGVEVKKVTGKPLVVHLHASQYDRAGADARGWIFELEKFGMQEADRVIPVSYYTGNIVTDHYGIDSSKVRPIHNGAEMVESFSTKKKFPEKLVLFLGRLTAQKGPEFFLEIAAKVLEKNPDVRFVMAGTGEKLKPLIESGAFKGLGDHFHFTGFLNKEKVNEVLSMTDVYCMPSVSEPFGLSALEAAQFGIPAVISRQSGVAEVLKGALVADFWDVDLMAKHISDLISDDELCARIVKQAEQDITQATWEAAASRVVDVYRELV